MSPDRAISPALPRRQRLLAALLAAAIATLSACGSDAPPGTSTGTVADNGTPTTPARKPNILYIMADTSAIPTSTPWAARSTRPTSMRSCNRAAC